MTNKIRWGILGAGGIANTFAKAVAQSKCGVNYAIGSRNGDKAREFASRNSVPNAYGTYQELLADKNVDAVYVATPHPIHRECVLAAAEAGKHILCEKPMGVTVAECEEMIAAAKKAGVVLLEAFMYRMHPQTIRIQELLRSGHIGAVRTVRSSFTYGLGRAYNVRTDKSLRGGGLYDVGCYCINFSRMAAGEEPTQIEAVWRIGPESGVDENLAATLKFPSGAIAIFDIGIRSAGSSSADILGSEGRVLVPNPWKPDSQRSWFDVVKGGKAETIVIENAGHTFTLEADHLAAVVAGETQPIIPAENAVGNAKVLETLWNRMHG